MIYIYIYIYIYICSVGWLELRFVSGPLLILLIVEEVIWCISGMAFGNGKP